MDHIAYCWQVLGGKKLYEPINEHTRRFSMHKKDRQRSEAWQRARAPKLEQEARAYAQSLIAAGCNWVSVTRHDGE